MPTPRFPLLDFGVVDIARPRSEEGDNSGNSGDPLAVFHNEHKAEIYLVYQPSLLKLFETTLDGNWLHSMGPGMELPPIRLGWVTQVPRSAAVDFRVYIDGFLLQNDEPLEYPLSIDGTPLSKIEVVAKPGTEVGNVQKWLVFWFVTGGCELTETAPELCFPLTVRVLCAVANKRDAAAMLNPDATPFYPQHLKKLFDAVPSRVSYGPMVPIPSFPPVQTDLSQHVHCPPAHTFADGPPMLAREFSRIWTSLNEEQTSMIRDMRLFDQLECTIRWDSLLQMHRIHVPGLLEKRPQLIYGDIVRICFAEEILSERREEVQCQIHKTQGNDVIVNIPFPSTFGAESSFDCLVEHRLGNPNNGGFKATVKIYASFVSSSQAFDIQRTALRAVMASHGLMLHGTWLQQEAPEGEDTEAGMAVAEEERWAAREKLQIVAKSRGKQTQNLLGPDPTLLTGTKREGILSFGTDNNESSSRLESAHSTAMLSSHDANLDSLLDATEDAQGMELEGPLNGSLNFEQQCCVADIVYLESTTTYPYAIHGPPGTGKTRVVIAAATQIVQGGGKVLIVAPSNAAADVIITRVALLPEVADSSFRLLSFQRPVEQVPEAVLPFTYTDPSSSLFGCPPLEALKEYNLIAATCISAAMLLQAGLKPGHFSHIIYDEAGQATEPECLVPLILATDKTKVSLVGDPLQLSPVVRCGKARALGLRRSLLERLLKSPPYLRGAYGKHPVRTTLVQNYRSHEALLSLPSTRFYNGQLVAKAQKNQSDSVNTWEELPNQVDCPLLFYGVSGHHAREDNTMSYFNTAEVSVLVDLVQKLCGSKTAQVHPRDIGIIAPFRKQVYKIRQLLRQRFLGMIRVGTVEDYQGQEEKVIFISTVVGRNQHVGNEINKLQSQGVGLIGSDQRFNVAITRAKALLVIVGDPVPLYKDANWSAMLRKCYERKAYRGVPCAELAQGIDGGDSGGKDYDEEEDMEAAVDRMAELMLGPGDYDLMFPDEEDLDMHYRDEMEFRVML